MNYKSVIMDTLDKFSFLNDQRKLSLTNITVIIFVSITAFRALFGGSVLDTQYFKWSIQSVDYSTALTVLFSLWNYDRKRTQNNQIIDKKEGS